MIARVLRQIFSPPPFQRESHEAYARLVAQARKPWFYERHNVPDTIDGRFDVIVLHLFLLIHRLRGESSEEAGQFIRAVSEAFFADMDRSLREMGASDTGVGKRMKKMVQAFYGRLQNYEQSLTDPETFRDSLKRNLYRAQANDADLAALGDYVSRNAEQLKGQSAASIISGDIAFSD